MKKSMKITAGVAAGVVGIAIVGGLAAGGETEPVQTADTTEVVEAKAEANATPPQPEPKPEPSMTKSQENAVESAQSYLSTSSFSRGSLIDQLEFEQYSTKDATFAVDYIAPNWKAEAAESAQSYLNTSSFSRQGLIDQLIYEQFTRGQAEYGVNKAGL